MQRVLFIIFLFFSCRIFSCTEIELKVSEVNFNSYNKNSIAIENKKPSPVWFNFLKRKANRKKTIASLLAFPIPGGILGLHRIYLGTEPYVPLIYIFTLGGGLILPIIDFCV